MQQRERNISSGQPLMITISLLKSETLIPGLSSLIQKLSVNLRAMNDYSLSDFVYFASSSTLALLLIKKWH